MAVLGGVPAVLGTTMTATASGSIADGKPVVINANGTVSQAAVVAGAAMYLYTTDIKTNLVEYFLDEAFAISNNGVHLFQMRQIESHSDGSGGFTFSTDGTKLFTVGLGTDKVIEYALSVAYDINTMKYVREFSVASQDDLPMDLKFNADGTKMFVLGSRGDDVNEYALSTGFNISTASFTDAFGVGSQETDVAGLAFNTDGTKMFVIGTIGHDVNEYALSTGFDVSTASFTDAFSVNNEDTSAKGVGFNADGTKMYITGDATETIYSYTLSTGFDVSTASVDSTSFDIRSHWPSSSSTSPGNEPGVRGIAFHNGYPSAKSYIGISSGAYSDGNTVTIQLMGAIDDAQSSMTAGRNYYVQRDGTVGLRITPVLAGVALTQTKLLVKGAYEQLFNGIGQALA